MAKPPSTAASAATASAVFMSVLQAGGPDQGQAAQCYPQAERALVGVKYAGDKARGRHDNADLAQGRSEVFKVWFHPYRSIAQGTHQVVRNRAESVPRRAQGEAFTSSGQRPSPTSPLRRDSLCGGHGHFCP